MPSNVDALPPSPHPLHHPHVYVINSDPSFLEMIGELLADVRLRVTLEQMLPNVAVTADNVRTAQPDLVMLDVVPFRREAELLLEQMVADAGLRLIPVMLASTNQDHAWRLAGRYAVLVRDVLRKPFDLDEFYAKLGRLVAIRVP